MNTAPISINQAIINVVKELSCEVKALRESIPHQAGSPDDRYIAVPQEGGDYLLLPGVTEFDFERGAIKNPDGTVMRMSTSLLSMGLPRCRSVRIDLEGGAMFWLDSSQDKRSIYSTARLAYQEFVRLYIEVREPVKVKVWASTAPEALINDSTTVIVNSPPGAVAPAVRTKPGGNRRCFNDQAVFTSDEWRELCALDVEEGKRFELTCLGMGCAVGMKAVLMVDDSQATPVFQVPPGSYTQLYFPSDYLTVEGPRTVHLLVIGVTEKGEAHGEIVGECD